MKFSLKTLSMIAGLAVILFITGYFNHHYFTEALFPTVNWVFIQDATPAWLQMSRLIFSITLAIAPILILLVLEVSAARSAQARLLTVGIVIVCMIAGVIIRHQTLITQLKDSVITLPNNTQHIEVGFPADEMYYEFYLLGGLVIGALVSRYILKRKKFPTR